MFKVVICDEDYKFVDYLSKIVDEYLISKNVPGTIVLKHNDINEVNKFLNPQAANIFFLDVVYEKKLRGIDIASRIRKENVHAYIVFVTYHDDFVLKSFKARPFDYLCKPIRRAAIENLLDEISDDYKRKNFYADTVETLSVKRGSTTCLIPYSDIFLIERMNRKIAIHTENEVFVCYQTLDAVSKKLNNLSSFIRCHRSYIVNKAKVLEIKMKENKLILNNGKFCFIGKTFKSKVLPELFNDI